MFIREICPTWEKPQADVQDSLCANAEGKQLLHDIHDCDIKTMVRKLLGKPHERDSRRSGWIRTPLVNEFVMTTDFSPLGLLSWKRHRHVLNSVLRAMCVFFSILTLLPKLRPFLA